MDTDFSWNDTLSSTEMFGRTVSPGEFIRIAQNDPEYENFKQAAHILLYAPSDKVAIEDQYRKKAVVLMQMRFDGYLGFPGGLVDPGETCEEAVTRELEEEINWNRVKFGQIDSNNYLYTHVSKLRKIRLHFYIKRLTEEEIFEVIQNSTNAPDYGNENLGVIQVPLYTMGDSFRGFPCFLTNKFIGNSKSQLLDSLEKLGILSTDYIQKCLTAAPVGLNSD